VRGLGESENNDQRRGPWKTEVCERKVLNQVGVWEKKKGWVISDLSATSVLRKEIPIRKQRPEQSLIPKQSGKGNGQRIGKRMKEENQRQRFHKGGVGTNEKKNSVGRGGGDESSR